MRDVRGAKKNAICKIKARGNGSPQRDECVIGNWADDC